MGWGTTGDEPSDFVEPEREFVQTWTQAGLSFMWLIRFWRSIRRAIEEIANERPPLTLVGLFLSVPLTGWAIWSLLNLLRADVVESSRALWSLCALLGVFVWVLFPLWFNPERSV